jgi:hypothetical protein
MHKARQGKQEVPSLLLPLVVLLLIYKLYYTHHTMLVDLSFRLNQGY